MSSCIQRQMFFLCASKIVFFDVALLRDLLRMKEDQDRPLLDVRQAWQVFFLATVRPGLVD